MKAFKRIDNSRIYIKSTEHANRYILSATPTEPTTIPWIGDYDMLEKVKNGSVVEVELEDEKWVHPHLLKHIRKQLKGDE
jgi:hypothetical protein